MKPLILTDVDDCLLSWIEGFRKYCSAVLGREIVGKPATWDMNEWLGTDGTASQMVDDFNHTDWRFGTLSPIANAQIFLPTLYRRGFEIKAITCCSHNKGAIDLRKANLYHVFGDIFSNVLCLPLGASKTSTLMQFKNRNVVAWVEDKPSAALEGHTLGYPTFLMEQDHNLQYRKDNPSTLTYVDDWCHISDAVWDKV